MIGIANCFRIVRRLGARIVAVAVLATLSVVPSIARAHDRLDRQQTPAQQHSRFRWTNSCESVPQKALAATAAVEVETISAGQQPAPSWRPLPAAEAPRVSPISIRAAHGLRAPPAALL